jgi:hypothetical protein
MLTQISIGHPHIFLPTQNHAHGIGMASMQRAVLCEIFLAAAFSAATNRSSGDGE